MIGTESVGVEFQKELENADRLKGQLSATMGVDPPKAEESTQEESTGEESASEESSAEYTSSDNDSEAGEEESAEESSWGTIDWSRYANQEID